MTALIFGLQTIGSAAPAMIATAAPTPSLSQLSIPAELGQIQTAYRSPDSKATIIQIQDAHGNYEAQQNTSKLIAHLVQSKDAKVLLLEGSDEQLNPTLFHFFKDHTLNMKVADLLMQNGEFTGAEHYLLKNSHDSKSIKAYGIEDTKLYTEDIALFRKLLINKIRSQSALDIFQADLTLAQSRIFSKTGLFLQHHAYPFR